MTRVLKVGGRGGSLKTWVALERKAYKQMLIEFFLFLPLFAYLVGWLFLSVCACLFFGTLGHILVL